MFTKLNTVEAELYILMVW